MTSNASTLTAQQLRVEAAAAIATASRARHIAADISARGSVLGARLDESVARHTDAVWASRAADHSRSELREGVGFAVWSAIQGLGDTRRMLEALSGELEDCARRGRAEAAVLEEIVLQEALVDDSGPPSPNRGILR